jgi:signal transduction histidine kinase
MNPLSSVGAKLSLALAFVVALALLLVYLVVVPSLRQRLVDARLGQLESALPQVLQRVPQTQADSWSDFLETASARANARVVVYEFRPAVTTTGEAELVGPFEDSHGVDSRDVVNDPIAQRAANNLGASSGTVIRGGTEFAEVASIAPTSLLQSGGIVLISASLEDALSTVHTVQRRLLEAGVLALALALAVGYGAAFLFARRIRRLETAAERIAAGRFDEPVVDRSVDELGELARAFDRMRLRLSQLERARREFIGNASHELRTPLFSLRGFIELLTEAELDEPTRREFLETMRQQVDRLARLAEDLLDLTRLDAGRLHFERYPVDLAELARDLVDEFRAVAQATGHPLEAEGEPAEAFGDEERIRRIGRALIENALRHTPPGTPIRIRSARTAFKTASLVVEDDGGGIADEHARHVFDRFYRADGGHASGSGLGLAIAHELAEAMGGTLELDSHPGRTTFTLRLPAPPGGESEPFPRENAPAAAPSP